VSAAGKEYYARDPAASKARQLRAQRKLKDKGPEANRAASRASHQRHKDKDPEALLAYGREVQRKLKDQDPVAYARMERARRLRRQYGIGPDDFDALLHAQGGVCAITGRPPADGGRLAVDHCHETGTVRGLLHPSPNTGLGMFQDDPAQLLAAAVYLLLARGDADPKATLTTLLAGLPIVEGRIEHTEVADPGEQPAAP